MSPNRRSACRVALKRKIFQGYGPLALRAAKLTDGGSRWQFDSLQDATEPITTHTSKYVAFDIILDVLLLHTCLRI
jgi:hypothetical protein